MLAQRLVEQDRRGGLVRSHRELLMVALDVVPLRQSKLPPATTSHATQLFAKTASGLIGKNGACALLLAWVVSATATVKSSKPLIIVDNLSQGRILNSEPAMRKFLVLTLIAVTVIGVFGQLVHLCVMAYRAVIAAF